MTALVRAPRRLLAGLRRALHRLVHPDFEKEQERLAHLARMVRKHAEAQGERLVRQQEQLGGLSKQIEGHGRAVDTVQRTLREIRRDLAAVRSVVDRQRRITARALKRSQLDEAYEARVERFLNRTARFAQSDRPILVGPWIGEVGFELLYWIPFVNWVKTKRGLSRDRLIVVSRGGTAPWYRHISDRYIDVLSKVTPEEFRAHTELFKKQKYLRTFDRQLIRRIARESRLGPFQLLHPALMYGLFRPFWKQQATFRRVEAFTRYQPLEPAPGNERLDELPREYVAVRFYFSDCFPDTPANHAFVAHVLRRLTERTHVVVLNTDFHVDDHRDYAIERSDRVHTITHLMRPENNLAVQSAVISRARAFVGTYGGYSYLAPLYGVSSLAFYSVPNFYVYHFEVAQRLLRRLGRASLVLLDVADAGLVTLALQDRVP